ncbi:MAG: Abi family protein [Christensenellaceae bacterium]
MRKREMGEKVYLTYEQQIEKLKRDGLIVPDEREAKRRLKWEGYYNFAVGYNRLFKDDKKRYIRGTRFDHIEALYDFDKHLRGIVYEYTQAVECNIKALVADTFNKRYGVTNAPISRRKILPPRRRKGKRALADFHLQRASRGQLKEDAKSYRDYIAHNARVYGHVPLWALISSLSFGNTSKFLKLMKGTDRAEIAEEYGLGSSELCNMTEMLVGYRNIAAHGERVFCARLPAVRLTEKLPIFRSLQIPRFPDGRQKYGRCDFLALVVIFKYMLPKGEFSDFLRRTVREVDAVEKALPPFAMRRVYEETGLSGAWRKLDAMKK